MKNYIKSVGALTVICAVIAILLALTNSITAPIIEKNANYLTVNAIHMAISVCYYEDAIVSKLSQK